MEPPPPPPPGEDQPPPDNYTEDEGSEHGSDNSDNDDNQSFEKKSGDAQPRFSLPKDPLWDPTKCSPIFFGRSRMTQSEDETLQQQQKDMQRIREQRALITAKVF